MSRSLGSGGNFFENSQRGHSPLLAVGLGANLK